MPGTLRQVRGKLLTFYTQSALKSHDQTISFLQHLVFGVPKIPTLLPEKRAYRLFTLELNSEI
jgi:hypothetical protein